MVFTECLGWSPERCWCSNRGYIDFQWWLKLSQQKVVFVTRLKDNADYGVIEQRPVSADSNIVRDEVILLTAIQEQGP